ncbi:MAG: GreA/GreB family elongation factor [Polyangiaceae bacterium]
MADKAALVFGALEQLRLQLEELTRAANATREGAVHEEARPENDKDTRALEQSYLARGQAQRVVETEAALQRLRFMELREFGEATPIALSALIRVEVNQREQRLFLVNAGGGIRLMDAGGEIQLVSVEAPLGQALVGKEVGEAFELRIGGALREYEILEVE